ncbi:PREDICTED: SH3 domain-binding glutamic acid-rich-like protein 3, partial [Pterocles gutturalis]|uniref:SH3 domain-binding glutamic acid-rich-like protein 3 n=1 Tax=Pterocles gutturalis TaxID=240206 RepID=UPI000528A649
DGTPWPGGVWTVACKGRGVLGAVGCVPTLQAPLQLPVTCFFTPPGFQIKSQQSEVTRILDGKNIKYELVDISQDNALREEMRAKAGNPKAIPPQIVNGDHYCGDYELFVEAVEQNTLQEFLKLA